MVTTMTTMRSKGTHQTTCNTNHLYPPCKLTCPVFPPFIPSNIEFHHSEWCAHVIFKCFTATFSHRITTNKLVTCSCVIRCYMGPIEIVLRHYRTVYLKNRVSAHWMWPVNLQSSPAQYVRIWELADVYYLHGADDMCLIVTKKWANGQKKILLWSVVRSNKLFNLCQTVPWDKS